MQKKVQNQGKDKVINIRVSEQQKEEIKSHAMALNMSVTEYLTYLDTHKSIVVIDGGEKLAHAMFELNLNLSKFSRYPVISVNEIQEAVGKHLEKINNVIMEER